MLVYRILLEMAFQGFEKLWGRAPVQRVKSPCHGLTGHYRVLQGVDCIHCSYSKEPRNGMGIYLGPHSIPKPSPKPQTLNPQPLNSKEKGRLCRPS